MTIGNALQFMKRGMHENNLRKRLNSASDSTELNQILTREKLIFSNLEFEEAFTHKLTQCQEAEDAARLKEFRMWWLLLGRIFEPTISVSPCQSCGTNCK